MEEDKRYTEIKNELDSNLSNLNNTYSNMQNEVDSVYQQQIDESKRYADEQAKIQQEQGELALQNIADAQAKSERDYQTEQRGAYADYQAQQKNQADKLRAMGLQNTGYTETTISNMYNTYQNRVATARQSYQDAVTEYTKQMTEARLANSSALAELAHNAFQEQAALALQQLQTKNTLTLDLMDKTRQAQNDYWGRYQDIQQQINTEKSMAEQIRQFNEKMAEEKRQYNQNYALNKKKIDADVAYTQAQTKNIQTNTKINNYSYNKQVAADTKAESNNVSIKESKTYKDETTKKNALAKTENINDATQYGNSTATVKKDDYYASNGYQPMYYNNQKLVNSGLKIKDLNLTDREIMDNFGVKQNQFDAVKNQTVWKGKDAKGNDVYLGWSGNSMSYAGFPIERINQALNTPASTKATSNNTGSNALSVASSVAKTAGGAVGKAVGGVLDFINIFK